MALSSGAPKVIVYTDVKLALVMSDNDPRMIYQVPLTLGHRDDRKRKGGKEKEGAERVRRAVCVSSIDCSEVYIVDSNKRANKVG